MHAQIESQLAPYVGSAILIVDDDRFICSLLNEFLSGVGMHVASTTNGKQAIELIQTCQYDIIFSDIYMPDITGERLLEIKNQSAPDTPFILMTGAPTVENSIQAIRLGAYDFVVKPFTLDTVAVTLSRALRYRSIILENRAYQENLEGLVQQRTRELQDFLLHSVKSLIHALEARDPYTQGHGYNVSRLVVRIAEELGIPRNEFINLQLAAELHDIGKIGIPDAILLKEGPLSAEEYSTMKDHVEIGYKILSPIPSLKIVSRYVYEHHERMDGKGYPRGLGDNDIHFNSRILIVSEVCDALAAKRCYKPPWPKEKILDYFNENKGTAYDADVVAALNSVMHRDGDEILRMLQGNMK